LWDALREAIKKYAYPSRRVFRLEALTMVLLEYSQNRRTTVSRLTNTQAILKETIDMLNPPDSIKIIIEKGMRVKTKKLFDSNVTNLLSKPLKI